ncbi:PQQ-binding-like beta-propeller repeat protein [Thalassoglobus sp.]|uniref:outer membrane protein assembly factor BamB family protein n=1 Tax=Thalassoglobus sp. TaxID=2795869 RepID=UPI003AA9C4F4
MAFLEIVHISGEVDQMKLSKQQPLTIGSHSSTDITIDEDNVEIMHCRISWGKGGYEAVAAGTEPIEVNGNLVQRAVLKAGDTLRFGSVDIRYRDSKEDGHTAVEDEHQAERGLKPLSEEIPAPRTPSQKASPEVDEINEDDLIEDDLEILDDDADDDDASPGGVDIAAGLAALAAAESQGSGKSSRKKKQKSKPKQKPKAEAQPKQPASKPSATVAPKEKATPESPEPSSAPKPAVIPRDDDQLSPRLREAMRNRQRRPGEEDPFRSPLVLALTGGAAALMLTGAIFFFIASRQTAQQQFDQANALYEESKFQPAIEEFQKFAAAYPRLDLTVKAKTLAGLARVRKEIDVAAPKFEEGLTQLRVFIRENSDRDDEFEALHPEIVTHARTISLEAAQAAGKQHNADFLKISREARTILNTYAPKDNPPKETLDQIETALRVSEAEILKNDVYKDHVDRMSKALANEDPAKTQPLEALKIRRDLLVRYPQNSPTDRGGFARDKKVVELFNKALTLEQKKVVESKNDIEAVVEDDETTAIPLTLAFHGRTRTDEVSVGKSVIAIAKDCCYGVDFVTGEPIWRRVVGFDTPFFPIQESQLPSVILFDTNKLELVRLNQTTGQLIWKQPLNDFVTGRPLLVDNTIYVSTESGRFLAVDLATGLIAGQLNFSQPISSCVELEDEQHLFLAGNEEVCYTISKRPLACVKVSYLGQQPASVDSPLLEMGPYVLMIENKTNSARLRLMNVAKADEPATEVASAVIGSRVIDDPVIRGRNLFVPATGELIYAFSVSDDPGQPPLTKGPIFDGQGSKGDSINLLTGPNGQVWMATDALNRLQLSTDSLQPDGSPAAPGVATQPLQMVSGYLLNARRRAYTDAVTFTRTNRDDMTSDWQVVLGGELLAITGSTGDSINIAAINEAGQAFKIGSRQLSGGKFVTDASVRLPLHQDLETPLVGAKISGNRIAVACGNPEPRLWIINAAGQIEGSPRIPEPVQTAPASLGDRVVLPLNGRLHVVRLSGQAAVQDYLLPTGEEHEWKSLAAVGEDQLVAVTKKGLAILLKIQPTPRPHLAEVAKLELGAAVLTDVAATESMIAIADASKKLTLFDTVRLDPIASRTFSQPITSTPQLVDNVVYAEAGSQQFHAMKPDDLSDLFTSPLKSVSVTGIAKSGSKLIVAQQNGIVSEMNSETGEVTKEHNLKSVLSAGPLHIGDELFVITIDGTMFRLDITK